MTEQLTWSRGWAAVEGFMRRAALGETAAHLEYLLDHGEVSRGGGTPFRYTGRRAAAGAERAAYSPSPASVLEKLVTPFFSVTK